MKFSLFIVAIALMGCSTHKGQRHIASEPGDFVVRTIQQEIGNDYHEPGQGFHDYVYGTSAVMKDLFAGQTAGESDASMTMPSPDVPEGLVGDLKLKRVFLYISSKGSKNYYQRLFNGSKAPGVSAYESFQMSLNGVDILKYQKSKPVSKSRSFMYVIITDKVSETKKMLRDHPVLGDLITSIYQMKSGLVVETGDLIAKEKFGATVANEAENFEKLGVKMFDQCTEATCLDLSGENVNLLPLGKDELKFHAKIKSKKIAETSKVDGFVEFELKVQLDGI